MFTLDVKQQQNNNNNMFCCWTLCFEMDFISLKLSFRPSTANYANYCNMYIIFLNKYCLNQYVLYNLAQIYIEVKKPVVKHPMK